MKRSPWPVQSAKLPDGPLHSLIFHLTDGYRPMAKLVRRSWFSIRLRTLMFLVTILCIWLALQLNQVRERQRARRELSGQFEFTTAESYAAMYVSTPPEPVASIPWSRRLFGDEAVQQIWYSHGEPTPETIARAARIFPEASVSEIPLEPCHPGCFPRGTLVETPNGPRSIEEMRRGDLVISIAPDSSPKAIAVQEIFMTNNVLWKVETERGELVTTETQPLSTEAGSICEAGKLKPGDVLWFYKDAETEAVRVKQVSRTGRTEQVINLILGDSQIFVAGGYLARSKPPSRILLADDSSGRDSEKQ